MKRLLALLLLLASFGAPAESPLLAEQALQVANVSLAIPGPGVSRSRISSGPVTLATDTFVRADSPNLGSNWTDYTAGWQIVSNTAQQTGGGSDLTSAKYNAVVFPNDQWAQVTLGLMTENADGGAGPIIRGTAGGDFILVQCSSTDCRAYTNISATFLQVGTTGPSATTGDVIYSQIVGTTLTVKKNGTNICGTPVSITPPSAGSAGLWGFKQGATRPSVTLWSGGTP